MKLLLGLILAMLIFIAGLMIYTIQKNDPGEPDFGDELSCEAFGGDYVVVNGEWTCQY